MLCQALILHHPTRLNCVVAFPDEFDFGGFAEFDRKRLAVEEVFFPFFPLGADLGRLGVVFVPEAALLAPILDLK